MSKGVSSSVVASSFWATTTRLPTELPVATVRKVSKLLPKVSTVSVPPDGAVHRHHAEVISPLCAGSPTSPV